MATYLVTIRVQADSPEEALGEVYDQYGEVLLIQDVTEYEED